MPDNLAQARRASSLILMTRIHHLLDRVVTRTELAIRMLPRLLPRGVEPPFVLRTGDANHDG